MAKILFINGSPHEKGCTYTALNEVAQELLRLGVESEFLWLGTGPVQDCIGCGSCRAAGKCVFGDDAVNSTISRMKEFDGIVVGSPVYYAGASGRLCSFLDRLFYSGKAQFEGKIGAAVVNCRRGGATAAFERLNFYFSIANMIIPGSQYWNQTHGFTPEDVMKDEEGLQTMRSLAVNIAWLLNSAEAGRKSGIPAPAYEKDRKTTNFI